jgi:FHA domain
VAGGRAMTQTSRARLELVMLDGTGRRFVLKEGDELTVGVAAHCGVRLSAPDVSRMHALISCRNSRVLLMDLGSKNGTFVGGRRIVHEVELAPGDSLRFSSMPAQVLPVGSSPAGREQTTQDVSGGFGDGWGPITPVPATGDRLVPVTLEALGWLLDRWGSPGAPGTASLVEWLVVGRSMRGAAVVERVGREINVAAAHGAMAGLLPRVGPLADIELGPPISVVPEMVSFNMGGERVVAIGRLRLPWLFLLPGGAMPDQEEIRLFVSLLAVAWRLDAATRPDPTRSSSGGRSRS